MDTESALLFFDEQHPFWTSFMFELAEQNPAVLEELTKRGFLDKDDDLYSLSAEGIARFKQTAEESFLPLRPGVPKGDGKKGAARSLLQLLLDKRHLQRWGIKEYCKPFRFEIPDLKEEELFELDGGKLSWIYPNHPVFKRLAGDFPVTGLAARDLPDPDPEKLDEWKKRNMPLLKTVEFDLLYKSRYDFQEYAHFPKLPADPCGLRDTDRFLFSFAPPPLPRNERKLLKMIGEFQVFLTLLRRMYLPGYIDRDSLDQDGINWFLFVYLKESDALECVSLLEPLKSALAGPAAPMEVWSISIEALQNWKAPGETIHDLLPFVARPIARVD